MAFWATFFPQQIPFRGLGLILYINRKQTTRNPTQPNPPQTPYFTGVHNNQDQIWFVKRGEYRGFMLIAGPDYYVPR